MNRTTHDLRHAFHLVRLMDDGEPADPTPASAPEDDPATAPTPTPAADPEPVGNPEAKRISDEAARYRHRAKEAEGKVEALTDQVRTLTLRLAFTIEATAANLTDIDAAWKLSADDLRAVGLNDDGTADTERLGQIVNHVANRYPYLSVGLDSVTADEFPPPATDHTAGRRRENRSLDSHTIEAKFPALARLRR